MGTSWLTTFVLSSLRCIMTDKHDGLMLWLSSMLTNALYVRSQPGTDYFVLSVCCCACFLALLCYQEYSYIYMGELTVWIVFPTFVIRMIDHCHWIAVWLQLHVHSLCHKPLIWGIYGGKEVITRSRFHIQIEKSWRHLIMIIIEMQLYLN